MLNQVHGFWSLNCLNNFLWFDWIGWFLVFGWQSLVPGGCGYRLVCGAESAFTHDTTERKWVSKHYSARQGVNGCQVRYVCCRFGWSILGHKFTESSGQLTFCLDRSLEALLARSQTLVIQLQPSRARSWVELRWVKDEEQGVLGDKFWELLRSS